MNTGNDRLRDYLRHWIQLILMQQQNIYVSPSNHKHGGCSQFPLKYRWADNFFWAQNFKSSNDLPSISCLTKIGTHYIILSPIL